MTEEIQLNKNQLKNSTMYRKTFHLKQHTPLIHFQHDQAGATLRATEVKPRLDRFIREDLMGHLALQPKLAKIANIFFGAAADAAVTAAQYRLQIIAPQKEPTYYFFRSGAVKEQDQNALETNLARVAGNSVDAVEAIGGTQFFANEDKLSRNNRSIERGSEGDIRLGVMYDGVHQLFLSSRNKDLLYLLSYATPYFFLANNFGTRKTKGFGSFTIKDSDVELKHIESCFAIVYRKNFNGDWKSKLKHINKQYKQLKNKPGTKTESSLRDYFKEDDPPQFWEKILVTQRIVKGNNDLVDKDGYKDRNGYPEVYEDDVRYVRALLGLAELHDYPQPELNVKVKIEDTNGGENAIQRFQSPLLFKVTNSGIYLIAREVPDQMKNKNFRFYIGDDYESSNRKALIRTPASFSITDFLQAKLKGFTHVK